MRAAAAAALAALLLLCSVGSSASGGDRRWRTVASADGGYSMTLPSGWWRSRARLVPMLMMPHEVVSAGDFGMAVGGGGECGREPLAAIHRMRPGEALLSIQEYAVGALLRGHLARNFPPGPPRLGSEAFRRAPLRGAMGTPIAGATIPFSEGGRAFDALVYFAGVPTPGQRLQFDAILAGLRFHALAVTRS